MFIFSKSDVNNNSAKPIKSSEGNDDDDVETMKTADAETLLPEGKSAKGKKENNNHNQHLEQDYPSDPNETDQVSLTNDFDVFMRQNCLPHFSV